MQEDDSIRLAEGLYESGAEENEGVLPIFSAPELMLAGLVTPLPMLFAMSVPYGVILLLLGHPIIAGVSTVAALAADWGAQKFYRRLRNEVADPDENRVMNRISLVLVARATLAIAGPASAAVLGGTHADFLFLAVITSLLLCVATAQGALSRRTFWASAAPVVLGVAVVVVLRFEPRTAGILLGSLALLSGVLLLLAGGGGRLLGDWKAMREKNNQLIGRLTAERELAEIAREEARRAGQAKANFLATMSHEIRTPMNGVLGMAQLLERSVTDDEQRRQVRTLIHSGEFLMSILNDILDISKIDAGKLEIAERPEPLRPVLEDLLSLWRPAAEERGLDLVLDVDADLPDFVHMDSRRLRQVLFNLVGNALKFTEAGSVTVSARSITRADGRPGLRLAVRDTGIGIAPAVLPTLFQRFSQVDQSISRPYGGAGLGLAIARQLVELMGGVIWAESVVGEGACFQVELPLSAAEGSLPARAEPRPEPVAEPCRDGGLEVLIVDDNPVNLTVLEQILGALGHTAVKAAGGPEALDFAALRRFDLILLDIQMPGMSGVEAVKALRRMDGPNRDAPVLAVTADVLSRGRADYIALGFTGHVSKPIQIAALAQEMTAVLAGDRAFEAA